MDDTAKQADQAAASLAQMAAAADVSAAAARALAAEAQTLAAVVDPLVAAIETMTLGLAQTDELLAGAAASAADYVATIGAMTAQIQAYTDAQNALNAAKEKGADKKGEKEEEKEGWAAAYEQITKYTDGFKEAVDKAKDFKGAVKDLAQEIGLITVTQSETTSTTKKLSTSQFDLVGALNATSDSFLDVDASATRASGSRLSLADGARSAAAAEAELVKAGASFSSTSRSSLAAKMALSASNLTLAETATTAAAAEAVALAPLAPILITIAAAAALVAGAFAGAFALATHEINKGGESAEELQKRLGLTDAEMKKLKESGESLSVTMGDTFSATLEVVGETLTAVFGDDLKALGDNIANVFMGAIDFVVDFARNVAGVIGGVVGGITAVWGTLPSAFGKIMVDTANFVISGLETMVNMVITGVGKVAPIINKVAELMGFDPVIGKLEKVAFPRVESTFKDAGKSIMGAFVSGSAEGRQGALNSMDKSLGEIASKGEEIAERARGKRDKRVTKDREQADAAGSPSGGSGARASRSASGAEDEYAKLVKGAEEAAAAMEAETKSQADLNNQVASGAKSYAEMVRAKDLEAKLAPLREAQAKADVEKAKELEAVIQRTTAAFEANRAVKLEAEVLQTIDKREQDLALLEKEISLIGKSSSERSIALAIFKEEQSLRARGVKPEGDQKATYDAAVKSATELAKKQEELREKQAAFNEEAKKSGEIAKELDQRFASAAEGLAKALDGVSKELGGLFRGFTTLWTEFKGLAEEEKKIATEKDAALKKAGEDVAARDRAEQDAARKTADARIGAYGDMAAAGKQFFEEGSAGYKAMQAAEIAFRAIEMVNSIRAMAQNTAETGTEIANNAAKAGSSGIAAVAKTLASLDFPYNLAAAATVMAALAAIGVSITGGGAAAGPMPGENDWKERQEAMGAGTVLGDAKAKSESIANALEIVAANTNRDLEYTNEMLKSLRSIDDQIGAFAAAIARSFGAGGMLSTDGLGLGVSGRAPSLSNLGFGKVTTKTLQDMGIEFSAATLDQILSGGLTGNAYQQILKTTKKSALGITYSNKSSVSTVKTALDADFLNQTELLIGSLRDGVVTAAAVLGVTGAEEALKSFTVNLGKLSFKDMSGEEIQQALEGVFGKLADQMAGAVIPGLANLQKVGEGLFETLARVARQYQVIDVSLKSIGKTFGAVGVSSLAARERLIDLFGSLDEFAEQTAFYAENFLSDAERLAPVQQAVTEEMARLGLASVDTRDEFKGVVQGLDLSTAAGAELYAALMAVAPAFAKVTEESQAVADARDALSNAYERESGALQDTADRFRDLASSLKAFREGLYTGPAAALSPEAQYQAAKAEFERVSRLAGSGDESALAQLQSVSQAYLDASRGYYASSQGYFDDLAAVRAAVAAGEAFANQKAGIAEQQLEALEDMVDGFLELNENVLTVAEALANLTLLLGGGGGGTSLKQVPTALAPQTWPVANDNKGDEPLVSEIQSVREELQAANEQRAAAAAAQDRRLARIESLLSQQVRVAQA